MTRLKKSRQLPLFDDLVHKPRYQCNSIVKSLYKKRIDLTNLLTASDKSVFFIGDNPVLASAVAVLYMGTKNNLKNIVTMKRSDICKFIGVDPSIKRVFEKINFISDDFCVDTLLLLGSIFNHPSDIYRKIVVKFLCHLKSVNSLVLRCLGASTISYVSGAFLDEISRLPSYQGNHTDNAITPMLRNTVRIFEQINGLKKSFKIKSVRHLEIKNRSLLKQSQEKMEITKAIKEKTFPPAPLEESNSNIRVLYIDSYERLKAHHSTVGTCIVSLLDQILIGRISLYSIKDEDSGEVATLSIENLFGEYSFGQLRGVNNEDASYDLSRKVNSWYALEIKRIKTLGLFKRGARNNKRIAFK